MEDKKHFFAVDLGATSGRTIIGTLVNDRIELEELTRFDNNLIETGGHFYWDIYALYFEVIKGLKLVAQRNIAITSIGIDTCGLCMRGQRRGTAAQPTGIPRPAHLWHDGRLF